MPGTFQTAGTVDDAGDIADVPGAIQVIAGGEGQTTLATDVGIDLILDNSGSMLEPLGNERRIDIAKQVLTELVQETLPQVSRWLYAFSAMNPIPAKRIWPSSWLPMDQWAAVNAIAAIESVDGVKTPDRAALQQVPTDLAEVDGPKIVVLVTDGEETCGGNPRQAHPRAGQPGHRRANQHRRLCRRR